MFCDSVKAWTAVFVKNFLVALNVIANWASQGLPAKYCKQRRHQKYKLLVNMIISFLLWKFQNQESFTIKHINKLIKIILTQFPTVEFRSTVNSTLTRTTEYWTSQEPSTSEFSERIETTPTTTSYITVCFNYIKQKVQRSVFRAEKQQLLK